MAGSCGDSRRLARHATEMNTADVIGDAMADYLLANGTNKAPARRAPAHMAAWLATHGYRIVRCPGPGPFDPGAPDHVLGSPPGSTGRPATTSSIRSCVRSAPH